MKPLMTFAILLALIANLSGCNIPTPPPPGPTPVPTESVPRATPTMEMPQPGPTPTPLPVEPTALPATEIPPSGSLISLAMLKNFTYLLDDRNTMVMLTDGLFEGENIHSLLIEPAAFGDLNGDGRQDAAVVLATNLGGSGTFFDLIAVLDQNGAPTQSGTRSLGDRKAVKNLTIADGRVVLDYLTQGLNDPLCCPSEHRLRSYVLDGGALRMASEQVLDSPSAAATPLPNAILIDQPEMWGKLAYPVQVRGRVSQVPPEKKLAYYVTDLQATLLTQGEIPVEGEVGGEGTFTVDIPLEPVPPGIIKVEIIDSANGILRGRSMVELSTP